jgi:hypothetical protein
MEDFKVSYKAEMQKKVASMVQTAKLNGGV